MKRDVMVRVFLWTAYCCVAAISGVSSFTASPAATTASPALTSNGKPIIPVIVLSGFLGSGKTCLLQHMLQNREGKRIAVIVNDVASVNIDSKLVSSNTAVSPQQSQGPAMVELQNGCACCSLSDELMASIEQLVHLSDIRGKDESFHYIVVELSGVADPKGIRAVFQEAIMYDMPVMERVQLAAMVTVVDCSAFLDHLSSAKFLNPDETPELFYRNDESPRYGNDDWMENMPEGLVDALMVGGSQSMDSGVSDLMVSQTETADVVLLNKVDLAHPETTRNIQQIVEALNPRARVIATEYGRAPLDMVLGAAGGMGVAMAGVVDDHKDSVQAADVVLDRSLNTTNAADVDCGGSDDCIDLAQSHSHTHASSHAPDHSHSQEDSCNDPDCTDPSHHHSHATSTTLADTGIGSFVYRARRPFHPQRLVSFLSQMSLKRGVPDGRSEPHAVKVSESTKDLLQNVVRSKGFAWCADSDRKALYWSHAGTSFEMQCIGSWWATLPRNQWPDEAVDTILSDFDTADHNEGDDATDAVGDRRQEIVFIGPKLGDGSFQTKICDTLDKCLVTESEWATYKAAREDKKKLEALFANPLVSRLVTY